MAKNWQAFWFFTGLKFKKVLSFKFNLITQTVAMFLNNLGLVVIWALLYARFGSINGYTFKETILLEGYVAIFFALFFWYVGGVVKSLGEYLEQDRFLDLQLYPTNVLVLLTTKSGDPSQFGDFFHGVLFLGIYAWWNPSTFIYMLVGIFLTVVGLYGISLFVCSIVFFLPQGRNIFTDLIMNIYVGAPMYPSQNFKGWVRYLFYLLLVIPVATMPIEVVRGSITPWNLLIVLATVMVINILGLTLWNIGIKRVEGGSGGGIVD